MATLAGITIYPLKSFDGVSLDHSIVQPSGALVADRRWALVDQQGEIVNGKRAATIHRIRAVFDLAAERVRLHIEGSNDVRTFGIKRDQVSLESWLRDHLGTAVTLIENRESGFPDDTEAPGPTVISTATLRTVSEWFGIALDEVRRRFRANLEIDDVEPFWEDRLFADVDRTVRFRIGRVELLGTNPCQRCAVPSRNPATGEVIAGFAKAFAELRKQALPDWATAARFDHFYRLAVNTRAAVAGPLSIGDEVTIVGVE